MTIEQKIIFFVTIFFFTVSSTPAAVLQEDEKGICHTNVSISRSRTVKNLDYPTETCVGLKWLLNIFNSDCWTIPTTITKIETEWIRKDICCQGYKYRNGTCRPECSSKCSAGDCVGPNKCACNYGWGGDLCDEPLYCVVRINTSEATSEPFALDKVQAVSENPRIEQMEPACNSKCRNQLDTSAVNRTRLSKEVIDYLIPIDSPCNTNVHRNGDSSWINWVGGVAGILLFGLAGLVAHALYIVRKRKKTRNQITNNQSTKFNSTDYMEENAIYS